jgi:chromodomain-helicase-DNA-binding protein 4
VAGFERYIVSRSVIVPKRSETSLALVENRHPHGYAKFALRSEEQPDLGQSSALKLMPFQVIITCFLQLYPT